MNTNLRSLKRSDKGHTMMPKPVLDNETRSFDLCESCGISNSCHHYRVARALFDKNKIHTMILHCSDYQQPFKFVDPVGTGGIFNTFRLGKASAERTATGDIVALVDKEGYKFGEAAVLDIITLPKDDAIAEYSRDNHTYIDQKLSKDDAARRMAKLLPNLYGGLIVRNNTHITVVQLRRSK
jgi:hypothetical protein